ncbi:MAG: iron-sulfur cluster repair di-iron protein, ric [Clostridiaceae bacterium]|jgi:iron-sulfur cluster repair protein YtfE (RIC family)|nr:iron-sulfur cluster repair di-iron protein, ric [Clostridiaceae bacterium]
MLNKSTFKQAAAEYFRILTQYVPVVDRVHGDNHPEFHEVRKLFDEIIRKTKEAETEKPELSGEFVRLREITDDYTVPNDVCESYEAVYDMLAEVDKAYHA